MKPAGLFGRIRQGLTVLLVGLLLAWITPWAFRKLKFEAQRMALAGIGRGAIGVAMVLAQVLAVLIVVIGFGLAAGFLAPWPLLLPTVIVAGLAEGLLLTAFWILAALAAIATVGRCVNVTTGGKAGV